MSQRRIRIEVDYCHRFLLVPPAGERYHHHIEVPSETLERWERAIEAFEVVQREIGDACTARGVNP